ncbi:MAG: GWxTD domain-containing protein [Balneolaceae bacterium]
MNPNIERGSDYRFQEGYPELRISAIGLLDEEENAVVNITNEIVYGSLIYRTIDDITLAQVTLEIRINEQDGDFNTTFREQYSIESDVSSSYTNQNVFTLIKDMDVEPGSYDIAISLTDNSSGKTTVRETTASIPDPDNPEINVTSIRLSGKSISENDSTFIPITTYNAPARLDSLKFDFQVTNNDVEDPLTVNTRLLHFESDTEPARPLYHNNYSRSSIGYKGIDVRDPEEIDTNTRRLDDPGSVLIEFNYPLLSKGNYRFEIETEDGEGETIYRARDFSVTSENYPNILTPREMAGPLFYLMDRDDHEEMMKIEDNQELKNAVDRFWLSHIGSQNRARSVINLYYERVEEANKQFSTFKEGWKTDMGMMYILFGPPWYVDRSLNQMQWSYSYDRTDPRYNFFFERPRNPNEFFPFTHYLIERSTNYFNILYQQRQLWLTGSIIESRL